MYKKDLFNYEQRNDDDLEGSYYTNEYLQSFLSTTLELDNLVQIKERISSLLGLIEHQEKTKGNKEKPRFQSDGLNINISDLHKVQESLTIERAKHYIKRIINSITEIKTARINDINLNRWKEYEEIITDSLWDFDKRDRTGAHNAKYWGNFIPQIPHQLLLRFTKVGDWVLDPFMGSGTTLIESQRLSRNSVGIDIENVAVKLAKENLSKEPTNENITTKIIEGDNMEVDYAKLLSSLNIKAFQFIILHPPYWDIIKFSGNSQNFSNLETLDAFLSRLGELAKKLYPCVEPGRYLALVMGDKYSNGQWIPLGFYSMQKFIDAGFGLKSIIVKNYEETRGKKNSAELWRYRALVGGFYVFKHEYIFLFKR